MPRSELGRHSCCLLARMHACMHACRWRLYPRETCRHYWLLPTSSGCSTGGSGTAEFPTAHAVWSSIRCRSGGEPKDLLIAAGQRHASEFLRKPRSARRSLGRRCGPWFRLRLAGESRRKRFRGRVSEGHDWCWAWARAAGGPDRLCALANPETKRGGTPGAPTAGHKQCWLTRGCTRQRPSERSW